MKFPLKIGQPRFLNRDEILLLHAVSLGEYGGAEGFLDEGAFDSAIAQARQSFAGAYVHEFPFGMAAAYGFHLAMNHAFRDGNKRVAFAAMESFLYINGWTIALPDPEPARIMLEFIESRLGKTWLADRLSGCCRPRPSLELRDFFQSMDVMKLKVLRDAVTQGREAEILASIEEAHGGISLLGELAAVRQSARLDGKTAEADAAGGQIALLVLLYRIAEDMGYEW